MARIIVAILLALSVWAGEPIAIQIATLPKTTIDARLAAFENTNVTRELRLRAMFENAGCPADHIVEQRVKHGKAPNLLCTLSGATDSTIVVGAHFDFVSRGQGVVDNWSGSSMLPSLYESLKTVGRRHTFVFAAFTDEELGLVGSKFYVHELGKDGRRKVAAMVNLDSLGVSPTKVERVRADKTLLHDIGVVATQFNLPISIVNVHNVGRSDSDSFADANLPSICVHSVTTETFPILHTPRDQMSAMHPDDYYQSYLLLRAYLAYLDITLDT